ncbi:MAG: MotA/TolQ/ExbB proton channel family protein [Pseudomonadota bacterium]
MMSKFSHSLKALGAAALFGLSSMTIALPANGQAAELRDILERVRQDSNQLDAEGRARLERFRRETATQQAEFDAASRELRESQARGNRLTAEVEQNRVRRNELKAQLDEEAGDFSDLLGQFRAAAGETMPKIRRSLSNFDPSMKLFDGSDRVAKLAEISEASTLPSRSDLDSLPRAMILEMMAQSEVKEFKAPVRNFGDNDGTVDADLFRIGVFSAASVEGTRFVEVKESEEGDAYLQAYAAQPRGVTRSSMAKLISAGDDELVKAPVDPSRGALFGIEGELPDMAERIDQGGPVGRVIIGILIVGAIMAFFKVFTLVGMATAMRKTAKTREAGDGDPLARVLEVYEQHKNDDLETLELKLDEQILKDAPKIERLNDIIKVLSAVAPLLGLLGTVVGMIITFTSITIYGAGDPKLMAGGISTALMTTVLGLVAAIPLLLLHAVTSSLARGNQQVLDEQAAGIVAERSERERGGAAA